MQGKVKEYTELVLSLPAVRDTLYPREYVLKGWEQARS